MKRVLIVLLNTFIILGLLTACGTRMDIAADIAPGNTIKAATDIESEFTDGSSTFAFDLFKTLNAEDANENIFISPLSISAALTMAYNGAENSTKLAMEKALGFSGLDRADINRSYKRLLEHLKGIDKKITLDIGNSIWIREGFDIKQSFIDTNKQYLDAKVEALDFNKVQAAEKMNDWISKATRGKIIKMVEAPINPEVIMYLINAIYFKGQWTKTFDKKLTTDEAFYAYDGKAATVRMMYRKGAIEYGIGKNYKAVRLPYGAGKTSMNIILPNDGVDINDFIQSLDLAKWREILDSISTKNAVILKMPKFKMEYGIKSLNDSLMALGMREAFSNQADFTGIAADIAISDVLHKAVIEVNEEGSEAAAATVVEMRTTSAEPISFIVNRPFIFLITDDTTGTLLFIGKVLSL